MTDAPGGGTRVAVLAQDLVWRERLAAAVERAGAEALRLRDTDGLDRVLGSVRFVIVDLAATSYDPFAAIERASGSDARVLAAGPHDDAALRTAARAHGAERVIAYRKLFADGPSTVAAWLAGGVRPVSS